MPGLLERLRTERLLLADGAWGSYFIEQQLDVACEPADAWNLRHPEIVARLADAYAAYADILTTNTFGANRVRLSQYQLANNLSKINSRGVAILRDAERSRRILDRPLLIAGSIGPARGPGISEPDDYALFDVYQEQAACLAEAGVNFLLLETFSAPTEAQIALRAAKTAAPMEVVCSYAFREGQPGRFETWSSDSVEAALKTALDAGADMVGANCVPATDALTALVDTMHQFAGTGPLWIKPNAGTPSRVPPGPTTRSPMLKGAVKRKSRLHYPHPLCSAPMDRILDALGHGVIGGCCGTSPNDIRILRNTLDCQRNRA